MIEIIPAIDMIGGKCVRLTKGSFDSMIIYSDNPLEMAIKFERAGFRYLHVVDLDGARTGLPSNYATLEAIVRETSLKVDYGGGIRSKEVLTQILGTGVSQVSVGSLAILEPKLFRQWIDEFGPERFFLGVDVRDEKVVYRGWQSESSIHWTEFIGEWMGAGIERFFCTDVERDGDMKGPATDLYRRILSHFPGINLVASGGVSGADDLRLLEEAGIKEVIVGKAIYEGKISTDDRRPPTADGRSTPPRPGAKRRRERGTGG